MEQIAVREATISDIEAIVALEETCFSTPWSRDSLYKDMTENPRVMYLIAESGGEVLGYMGLWQIMDEGHINNVAVFPAYRRRHVASKILSTMLELSEKRGIRSHTLEVRTGNAAAQKLYRNFGFAEEGLRKGYYEDTAEDALIMWRRNK